MKRIAKTVLGLGVLSSLALAGTVLAHDAPHTIMKFWNAVEKQVGGVYSERIEIFNTSPHVLDTGTLQINLPGELQLASGSSTISVPSIPVGGMHTVNISVRAVAPGNFAISEAIYTVGGTRYGFMSAPSNIAASAGGLGSVDDGVGGPTDDEAAAAALPRTGSPLSMTYFTLAMLAVSLGMLGKKQTW